MTALRLIGAHGSAGELIRFYEDFSSVPSTVKAKVGDVYVPVILPETAGFSSVQKVERALKNRHLQPEVIGPSTAQKEEGLRFDVIPPKGKVWEKAAELSLPTDSSFTIRGNGTISYSFMNTVVTWNWVDNTTTTQTYGIDPITTLAERADGCLVAGDAKGQLHIGNRIIPTGLHLEIIGIYPVSASRSLIKFEKGFIRVFDWNIERTVFGLSEVNEFLTFENGTMVFVQPSAVIVCDAIFSEYTELSCGQKVTQAFYLSKTKAVFLYEGSRTFALFDSETKEVGELYENRELCTHLRVREGGVLKGEELFVGGSSGTRAEILVYSTSDWKVKPLGLAHLEFAAWGVSAMALLTDGSLVCGTYTSNSGIHIVTGEGEKIFSCSKDLTKNRAIQWITELVDGSLAVDLEGRILILEQKKQLPLPSEDYQGYVLSLLTALKCQDVYRARRFYEKSGSIADSQEAKIELCEIFLSALKGTVHIKLHRQVLLDLWALQKAETLPQLLEEKKGRYKKRLFVGEGDFSFTESFLNKHERAHPGLAPYITATELLKPTDGVMERVRELSRRGTAILFGIRAETIHQTFQGKRWERIQWNCPFGDASPEERESFKSVIPAFFLSASQLQLNGDRIHVTLMQESDGYWKIRQKQNPIVLGASSAGYRLIRKRQFAAGESGRYPGYQHVMTRRGEKYSKGGEKQEFVFEKTGLGPKTALTEALELQDPKKKEYLIKADLPTANPDLKECYFECSTDEDSSDGYASD